MKTDTPTAEPTNPKAPKWCAVSTGNHQGLIIDEGTGRNVAVSYDAKDAPLLASALELREAACLALEWIEETQPHKHSDLNLAVLWGTLQRVVDETAQQ